MTLIYFKNKKAVYKQETISEYFFISLFIKKHFSRNIENIN